MEREEHQYAARVIVMGEERDLVILHEVLTPEFAWNHSKWRAQVNLIKEEGQVTFLIQARDLTALRALFTSVLRHVIVVLETLGL